MELYGIMELANLNPSQLAALSLAYIGDVVYDIYIRTRMINEHPTMPAHKLHLKTVKYVKAHAQSNSIGAMEEFLNEEETAVYRRGRNAKSHTMPKNADMMDYRRATGFEALLGYVYLKGDEKRLDELMNIAYENALDK